jgi:hypothetical protein
MAKIALMIGISEYGSGLNPLPNALRDIEAMQQVLQPLDRGGFDQVKCLANPNPPMMREAIETLFSHRQENDLLLLFFSGHIVQDNQGKLYFSTSVTCKTSRPELIRVSAIPASFVQDLMNNSGCQQGVLILDCCLDNTSLEEITINSAKVLDIKSELGGAGRVILSCFISSQKSWGQEEIDIDYSTYTSYLIEGMKTGIADLDDDGWIAVNELHQYASNKLKIAAPALEPEFYSIDKSSQILLLLAPTDEPKLQYRKEVEKWVSFGEISPASNYILDKLAADLLLTSEACQAIKEAVLKPYQEYQEKLQRYQGEYEQAIANTYFLDNQRRNQLRDLQQFLALRDEAIVSIEEQVALDRDQISLEQNELDILPNDGEDTIKSLPPTPEPVVISSPVEPTVSASQDQVEQPMLDSISIINSPLLPPSIVVPDTPITPRVNVVTTDLNNSSTKVSPGYNKFLLPLGIGGILTMLAIIIAFFHRTPVVSPPTSAVRETTISEKPSTPTPSPSVSPQSQVCTVFINGNLRSEPTYLKNNIVEALREAVSVTGKQTKGGWVEVKMPNDKLAWAYQDIISEQGRKELKSCLTKNKIKITLIEDVLPPASTPSPST